MYSPRPYLCTLWRPNLKTTLIISSLKHSSFQCLSGLQNLINWCTQQILRNDVVLLLPMEMGNWDSEILHLKCPAVLGVSFESPDLVGDGRFCGTLIALGPVADFSPLFYKAVPAAHIGHRQDMENTGLVCLCPASHTSPAAAAQTKSIFPGSITLIQPWRPCPPSSPGPYCICCEHFVPTATMGKDGGHVSYGFPYLQKHSKPLFPWLSRQDTFFGEYSGFLFCCVPGFPYWGSQAITRGWYTSKCLPNLHSGHKVCTQTHKLRGHLRTGNIAKGTPHSRTNHAHRMRQKSCWKG